MDTHRARARLAFAIMSAIAGIASFNCGDTSSSGGAASGMVDAAGTADASADGAMNGCSSGGELYSPGDTWTAGCNICRCIQAGEMTCTTLACIAPVDSGSFDGAAVTSGCGDVRLLCSCGVPICSGQTWICPVTACPVIDASAPVDASMPADASAPVDASVPADANVQVEASAADAQSPVECGNTTCGSGEWCDTSGSTPTCRCSLNSPGPCGAGLVCCTNPLSGCGPLHCNQSCRSTCP